MRQDGSLHCSRTNTTWIESVHGRYYIEVHFLRERREELDVFLHIRDCLLYTLSRALFRK